MSFQIVIAHWVLDAHGPAHDVLALEHVKDDESLCLVYSTNLPLDLSDAQVMSIDHLKACSG